MRTNGSRSPASRLFHREHDGLSALQALGHGRAQELFGAGVQLWLCDAAGQERAHLAERQAAGAILDQAIEEAVALGVRRRDHDEQAPG